MKITTFILIFVCLLISCASLPPVKNFTTELWKITSSGCEIEGSEECHISRLNDDGEEERIQIKDLDPSVYIVVDIEDIKAEWEFQALQEKSCEIWR